jgi:hypothetical protein
MATRTPAPPSAAAWPSPLAPSTSPPVRPRSRERAAPDQVPTEVFSVSHHYRYARSVSHHYRYARSVSHQRSKTTASSSFSTLARTCTWSSRNRRLAAVRRKSVMSSGDHSRSRSAHSNRAGRRDTRRRSRMRGTLEQRGWGRNFRPWSMGRARLLPLPAPGDVDLVPRTWRCGLGATYLAMWTWRHVPGDVDLAPRTWRSGIGATYLAIWNWCLMAVGVLSQESQSSASDGSPTSGCRTTPCTFERMPHGFTELAIGRRNASFLRNTAISR